MCALCQKRVTLFPQQCSCQFAQRKCAARNKTSRAADSYGFGFLSRSLCFCVSVPDAVQCLSYIILYSDKHCVPLDVTDWAPCLHFTPEQLGLLTIQRRQTGMEQLRKLPGSVLTTFYFTQEAGQPPLQAYDSNYCCSIMCLCGGQFLILTKSHQQ